MARGREDICFVFVSKTTFNVYSVIE